MFNLRFSYFLLEKRCHNKVRSKLILTVLLSFSLLLLAGCNEFEEILSKVNQLLDEQLESSNDDQGEGEREINKEESNENGATKEEATTAVSNEADEGASDNDGGQSIEEKLIADGYTIMDIPNGLMFEVPEDWYLVEDNLDDPQAESYDATFCFETPSNIEQYATDFASRFDDVNHEHFGDDTAIVHRTAVIEEDFDVWYGDFAYAPFEEYTCAYVTIWIGEYDGPSEEYGEDPDSMFSEDEL